MESSIFYALTGGLLIGLSVSLLMWTEGKICGLSGIFGKLLSFSSEGWRWLFLLGFALGAFLMKIFFPDFARSSAPSGSMLWVIVAGLLVGFGTRLGGGCTSGHGICGISRLSKRSVVATLLFMGSAMVVVFVRKFL
ncbi:MAG: YeeE/YedE family protein [Proteobacteria bacterium]|jgi:uncharacterized membrane protein YedE/YeeE|nr:YeeE/YedE family protein [Pseudomonadota bacterium]